MQVQAANEASVVVLWFFSLFWPCRVARGISAPWPGIEPRPLAVRAASPNHWSTRDFPVLCLFCVTLGAVRCPSSPRPQRAPVLTVHSRCSTALHTRSEPVGLHFQEGTDGCQGDKKSWVGSSLRLPALQRSAGTLLCKRQEPRKIALLLIRLTCPGTKPTRGWNPFSRIKPGRLGTLWGAWRTHVGFLWMKDVLSLMDAVMGNILGAGAGGGVVLPASREISVPLHPSWGFSL